MIPEDMSQGIEIMAFDREKYGFKGMENVPVGQFNHPRYGLVDIIIIPVPSRKDWQIGEDLDLPSGISSWFFKNGARPNRPNEWAIKAQRRDSTGEATLAIFRRQQVGAAHPSPFGPPAHRMCALSFVHGESGMEVMRCWGYGTSVARMISQRQLDVMPPEQRYKVRARFKGLFTKRVNETMPYLIEASNDGSCGWANDLGMSNVGKFRNRTVIVDFGFDCVNYAVSGVY